VSVCGLAECQRLPHATGDEKVQLHIFLYWNVVSAYISNRPDRKVNDEKRD
jgi:hypothetical protein